MDSEIFRKGNCNARVVSYFAAFLIDPDGNNVEAVCTWIGTYPTH
jgi:hypothetical protein